ncbi:hypothetical protein TNCT_448191 [Trichonephila clavata]|uniref:Uncharacterized protein n=1 Tax=Trichonephila clavata TaxID=2740835 RepID=A0A8X6K3Z8_TRICU|nr:hypothetical protein TNCT_448191 [Trichonephila clavata]
MLSVDLRAAALPVAVGGERSKSRDSSKAPLISAEERWRGRKKTREIRPPFWTAAQEKFKSETRSQNRRSLTQRE